VREFTSQASEGRNREGKLTPTGRTITQHVRKDAGDVRYLEGAMAALKEIRDLWIIGAEAESKLERFRGHSEPTLPALVQSGAVRITMKWGGPPTPVSKLRDLSASPSQTL
jgi:hypothetical protein